MSKITPGPWNVAPKKAMYGAFGEEARKLEAVGLPTQFEGLSIGTDNGQVAIIPLDESNEANAQLIAAAPELLEACIFILDGMEYIREGQFTLKEGSIKKMQDAIQKAEGK